MKADTIFCYCHDNRGIAESLHTYITRARQTVCEALKSTPNPLVEELLKLLPMG